MSYNKSHTSLLGYFKVIGYIRDVMGLRSNTVISSMQYEFKMS